MSVALLEQLVEMDGRDVLDVGCGEGYVARRLIAAGARVTGIDPLAGAIETARAAGDAQDTRVTFVDGTAEALPFDDASFDTVVFFNSLHHVPVDSMGLALEVAARVLRDGGVLYVQEPVAEGPAFELLRRIEDETAVRAAALKALERSLDGPFELLASREIVLTVRHADLAALRAHMVSVDPARAASFDAQEDELGRAFERLGRGAESGGREFDQPFRIELLRRRDANTAA